MLALVYYECPMLCTQVLNGLAGSLEALPFKAGKEFDVVVVSFDPGETPAMAAEKKRVYLKRYGRPGDRGRDAFPDRPRGIDQGARPSAVGLPLRLRRSRSISSRIRRRSRC